MSSDGRLNSSDNSQQILMALRRRDPQALAILFEQHADAIHRLALNVLGGDAQQADGVVQNTFIALIEHVEQFEGRARISTWLYRVAYNEALRRLRRARPQLALDDALDEDLPMPASLFDWRDLPEEALRQQEARAMMQAAIDALPASLRAAFTLRDVQEFSTREVAEILSISEAAVKVRLHRARLALREALSAYFEEYRR